MFGISFHSPLLLATGLVALLPVVLHFVARGSARTIPFSSLIFLRRAVNHKAKQIKAENRRLMLLRALAALLLGFALAQPVFKVGGTATVHPGDEVSAVLIFDNSMSMGTVENTRSRLARAKEAALTILDGFSEGDRVALLLASSNPSVLLGEPTTQHDECRDLINRIETSWSGSDLLPSFQEALNLLQDSPSPVHEIYIITDMQKSAWRRFEELPEEARKRKASVYLCDAGLDNTPNTAVTDVRVQPPSALPGVPVEITFEITHYGRGNRESTGLQCQFDDGRTFQSIFNLSPGKPATQHFNQRFSTPGVRTGSARLDRDALTGDNTRYFAVDIAATREVLVLDGSESTEDSSSSPGTFIYSALKTLETAPTGGFSLRVDTDNNFLLLDSPEIEDYDLIILAEPPRLNAEQVFRLRNLVGSGTGLVIFLGPNADIEALNRYASPDLIPGQLTGISDEPGHLKSVDFSYPPLALFRNLRNGDLSLPIIRSHHSISVSGSPRILASLGKDPGLIEQSIGRGEVIIVPFSADDSMTDFPARKIFLPLWAEFARHLTSRSETQSMVLTGDTISINARLHTGQSGPIQLDVELPGGAVIPLTLRGESRAVNAFFTETKTPGIYRIHRPSGTRLDTIQPRAFAVNPPSSESDLTRASANEIRDALNGFPVRTLDSRENLSAKLKAARSGSPLWNIILLIALGVLLFETWASHRAWR